MKKTYFKTVFFAVCLLFWGSFCFASDQNNSSVVENASATQTQSFNINTDPSQIMLGSGQAAMSENNAKEPSAIWLFIKMIFALAVVVAIAWLIFYLMKKTMKTGNDNDPFLRKVSQLTLSPGKSVQIITLQDSAFLIGVSDENISLLGKVDDKELVNAMNLYADKNDNVSKPRSFREILDIFMPGSSKEGEENLFEENIENSAEKIKEQREKFDFLK